MLVVLEPALLDHLVVEFGGHGRRAVEFLGTARWLLSFDAVTTSPRRAEAVVYCLREAMKTIPASFSADSESSWGAVSREVVEARRRFELVRGVPGVDAAGALDGFLVAVSQLEDVHGRASIHEQRLIALMVKRTGTVPLAAGTEPIRNYQTVLSDLDARLHGDCTDSQACDLWNRCAVILRQLFLPPEVRHAELEALAILGSVTIEELDGLWPLLATPGHLQHFLSKVTSTVWLDILVDTGVLDPPNDNGPWPMFAVVDRLAPTHGPSLITILERLYERHGSDAARALLLVHASLGIGGAAPLVLRALGQHRSVPAIAHLAGNMVEALPADDEAVEAFADVLLNRETWQRSGIQLSVAQTLAAGINAGNARRRVQLLVWKLGNVRDNEDSRRWFGHERGGSIGDWGDELREDRFKELLHGLADVLRRSTELVHVDELLAMVGSLPDDVQCRVRAFVLANAPDLDLGAAVNEVALAIAERLPTGDDLALIDRVSADGDLVVAYAVWRTALRPVPTVLEVAQQLGVDDIPREWMRAMEWIGALPEQAGDEWASQAALLGSRYGRPGRAGLERHSREGGLLHGQTPISSVELADVPVLEAADRIAAWRPDQTNWTASARELARTLEDLVKSNAPVWVESPVVVATRLHHPTYIGHFLTAIAQAIRAGTVTPVGELLDLIEIVRAHPWTAILLGRDDFDYDPDWRQSERSAIEVIKALAESNVGFAGRNDRVFEILVAETRDRGEPSAVGDSDRDPLQTAINRPCTRALEAAMSFMAYEFTEHGTSRPEAFDLIEDCLRISGSDGAHHRAIIAVRLGMLRHIAPAWLDGMNPVLFGDQAPEGLADTTIDTALKWNQPNRWLLEHHRPLIRSAVARGADRSVDWYVIAMLWDVPGYDMGDCTAFLQSVSKLSAAGEVLGHILSNGQPSPEHVIRASNFWATANAVGHRDDLQGFGWMSELKDLDDSTWASLTHDTLNVTGGRIDWSHSVAERAASLEEISIALAIMDQLVRGEADHWDLRRTIEQAVTLLERAAELASTVNYQRLRTGLLERGVPLPPTTT